MNLWHEESGELEVFDPLCIERSAPMDDEEATAVESLCQAATPGPLVTDDEVEVEGDGAVVVTLPDGQMIVSLTASVEHTEEADAIRANAELICKARYCLLRLLRDRKQWKTERDDLSQKIRELETALAAQESPPDRVVSRLQ